MNYKIFVFGFISCVWAQVPYPGGCPNVAVVQNFNLNKYMGKWYEIQKYFAWFEYGGKCVTAEYHVNTNGSVDIHNTQINIDTGIKQIIKGNAHPVGSPSEAKFAVNFPSVPFVTDAPYWVLGTDYNSYSVVWSCIHNDTISLSNAWILTREQLPSADTLTKAFTIINATKINRSFFRQTDQKNCPKD